MKKIFYVLAFVGVVLTGCKDNNSPENGNGAFTFTEDVSKPLEFDGRSAKRALNFTAQADWSVSIQQGVSKTQAKKSPQKTAENSPSWITVSPMSGQKGKQQITITCEPNNQETERSATITISDGVNTITITIVQKAQSADFDVFSVMDDAEFKAYCEQFDTNKDGKLSLAEANAVKSIDVHGEQDEKYNSLGEIQSLKGIAFFKNLEELQCQHNKITSLDVSKNTALTELWCNKNQLTSLDVSDCTALIKLNCSYNQLTSLNVSGCTALQTLECNKNQLTSLNVSNNTALTVLWCFNNQLSSLDITKNTALWFLHCSGNQLTELDVSKNTALTNLACYYNQLISLDVSDCTMLTNLVCSGNRISSLDLSSNTVLKGAKFLPNEQLSTLYLRNGKNNLMFYYGNGSRSSPYTGIDFSTDQLISIDDIKNKGIEVIYK